MIDRYWRGESNRISPEAPVPVVSNVVSEDRLGGAANVALNLVQLGCDVRISYVVGEDADAYSVEWMLKRAGIMRDVVVDKHAPTIVKLRVCVGNQQLLRIDTEQRTQPAAARSDAIKWADVVVLSDYDKGALADVRRIIRTCNEAGKQTIVDPKVRDWSCYEGATCIKPNEAEYASAINRVSAWTEALVVTKGAQGIRLQTDLGTMTTYAAQAKEVYDVTGAGDTVTAVLAWQRALGKSWPAATAMANKAAGIVVGKRGTTAISLAELSW